MQNQDPEGERAVAALSSLPGGHRLLQATQITTRRLVRSGAQRRPDERPGIERRTLPVTGCAHIPGASRQGTGVRAVSAAG
ncbi:MAG: hypothetical protein GXY34_13635 [Syntrophomonadaceae bacterium]|nr:hypothetical protein [Syntrophomonadaceae bacterium]